MSSHQAPYPPWIYRQSAVLPYRLTDAGPEVLLVTSRGGKHWLLPKGIVEPGMSALDSACKEAREEAGVEGAAVNAPMGVYRYRKWGGRCTVDVYLLRVLREREDWPEAGIRQRRWCAPSEALRLVDDDGLRALIERLPKLADASDESAFAEPVTPPRLLYLLRHAKSSWNDEHLSDEQRPLAPRGERACESMARYMTLADVHPTVVLCSSAVRTRQTLDRLRSVLGEDTPVRYDQALYLAATPTMLERLRGCDDSARSAMLIGHNPGMHDLALRLVGDGDACQRERLASKFPTGALAILVYRGEHWASLGDSDCELHSHVSPREIGEDPNFA